MCNHSGRINGWPNLVPGVREGNPDPQILQTARYFDGMNFAARSNAEAIFSVGFIDGVCRPTTVYMAYNNLPGKKQIINRPLMMHRGPLDIKEAFTEAFQEYIQRTKNKD